MSIAGIRSNRGDGYQTLVAFDWALTVLSNPDYQWLEVDSVALSVDDVVVGKSDGTKICCQCKKNQIDFKAWTIADLADELDKANSLLANDPQAEVRFYSRNPFGALAKLREHSTTQADETSYKVSLTPEHQKQMLHWKSSLLPRPQNFQHTNSCAAQSLKPALSWIAWKRCCASVCATWPVTTILHTIAFGHALSNLGHV